MKKSKHSRAQKDLQYLVDHVTFWGENDSYSSLIIHNLLPMVMAYTYFHDDEAPFGTLSKKEFLNQCQQIQHILLGLKEFADKYPDGLEISALAARK